MLKAKIFKNMITCLSLLLSAVFAVPCLVNAADTGRPVYYNEQRINVKSQRGAIGGTSGGSYANGGMAYFCNDADYSLFNSTGSVPIYDLYNTEMGRSDTHTWNLRSVPYKYGTVNMQEYIVDYDYTERELTLAEKFVLYHAYGSPGRSTYGIQAVEDAYGPEWAFAASYVAFLRVGENTGGAGVSLNQLWSFHRDNGWNPDNLKTCFALSSSLVDNALAYMRNKGGNTEIDTFGAVLINSSGAHDYMVIAGWLGNRITYYENAPDGDTVTNMPSPNPDIKNHKLDYTISTTVPECNTSNFVSWNTEPDGTGTTYKSGDTYSIDNEEGLKLYAQWEHKRFDVTYDLNVPAKEITSGAAGGKPEDDLVVGNTGGKEYDVPYEFEKTFPYREGYEFLGWYEYKRVQKTSLLESIFGTLEVNAGELTGIYKDYRVTGVIYDDVNNLTTCTKQEVAWEDMVITENAPINLKANWLVKIYAIEYDCNGGTAIIEGTNNFKYKSISADGVREYEQLTAGITADFFVNQKVYNVSQTITNIIPTRDGYVFECWEDDNGVRYAAGEEYEKNSDLQLHARWKMETKTLTYHLNGGSKVRGFNTTQEINQKDELVVQEKEPARYAYKFVGWAHSLKTEDTAEDKLVHAGDVLKEKDVKPEEDMDLYAIWQSLETTKIGWADYGDTELYETAETEDEEIIDVPIPKHRYMKFVGYYTEPQEEGELNEHPGKKIIDENGKLYLPEDEKELSDQGYTDYIKFEEDKNGKVKTVWAMTEGKKLYAQFEADIKKITFDANDGYISSKGYTDSDIKTMVSDGGKNLLNKTKAEIQSTYFDEERLEYVSLNPTDGVRQYCYAPIDSVNTLNIYFTSAGKCCKVQYKANDGTNYNYSTSEH